MVKKTGFLKCCNCKLICNYSLLSLCNVEECRCAINNYLWFYYFHTVYAMYAVNDVNVHVQFVKDTYFFFKQTCLPSSVLLHCKNGGLSKINVYSCTQQAFKENVRENVKWACAWVELHVLAAPLVHSIDKLLHVSWLEFQCKNPLVYTGHLWNVATWQTSNSSH